MGSKTGKIDNVTIRYCDSTIEPEQIVQSLKEAKTLRHLGRGGIKIIEIDGKNLVCRKYLHGGLLRLFTQDRFFSEKRCREEVNVIQYLRGKGFPVVTPFATLAEKRLLTYRLNLLTVFEQGAISLLDYLTTASHRDRLKMIGGFVHLFCRLQTLGVYHPDLHIGNVLVTVTHKLLILDFDRAEKRTLTRKDREFMLWRLWRHIDKMERQDRLQLNEKEKNHLIRTYSRVSGMDAAGALERRARTALYFHKVGRRVESLLYRGAR